jgi:hypothetical protein
LCHPNLKACARPPRSFGLVYRFSVPFCVNLDRTHLIELLTPLSPVVTLRNSRFKIQQFYVLPTQCIYVFCVDLRTNSYYFPIQH